MPKKRQGKEVQWARSPVLGTSQLNLSGSSYQFIFADGETEANSTNWRLYSCLQARKCCHRSLGAKTQEKGLKPNLVCPQEAWDHFHPCLPRQEAALCHPPA